MNNVSDADIIDAYDGEQEGGNLAYFVGKQYGSGWLRTLGRIAFPIIKRVFRVAGNVAQDKLDNPDTPILSSLRDNALNEVAETVGKTVGGISSINRGRKRGMVQTSSTASFYAKRMR